MSIPEARSQLAKFGLGADAVSRAPSSLSPGERTRAELAAFGAMGVNFLVLDEPTNHLDLPAIEQLESALSDLRRDAVAGVPRSPAARVGRTHPPDRARGLGLVAPWPGGRPVAMVRSRDRSAHVDDPKGTSDG